MKLQNLTIIFIIIIIPVILVLSLYISTGIKTIKYQSLYDTGLLTATHDAIYAFELNTTSNLYSDNAETKRNILKASVKAFEKSLCNTCNISSYNTEAIEEYIPAIVFGMYDGFYMYAPSYNTKTKKYEHSLKNYVYYSETLNDGTVIRYSLDNYITVSGYFDGKYQIKEGYLIDLTNSNSDGTKYKGINIDTSDKSAVKYYKEAYYFTSTILNKSNWTVPDYLIPSSTNDPEDENSPFVQHKREIMKNKIESVLNTSITAYSNRTFGKTYKMPKLTAEDWEKVYNNISMITFFQGKNIGLTKYNGYCVLNSTNSNEYVNANLMYFIDQNSEYHDIRCTKKQGEDLIGYKIGDFRKIAAEQTDEDGNTVRRYEYNHKELACYDCVNGSLENNTNIYEYIKNSSSKIQTSYWTSLGRERYNTPKMLDTACIITYELDGLTASNRTKVITCGDSFTTIITPENSLTHRRPKEIKILMGEKIITSGYTYNNVDGTIKITEVTGDVVIIASVEKDTSNISFETATDIRDGDIVSANIDQSYRVRVFKFTPTQTGTYGFWSEDDKAGTRATDPYAYLYDASKNTIEQLDAIALNYAQTGQTSYFINSSAKPITYCDDAHGYYVLDSYNNYNYKSNTKSSVKGYNFFMKCECTAEKTYYLVVRTFTPDRIQNFSPIYIKKQ